MEDSKDPFEVLADIQLPELQYTNTYSNIADGPFAVDNNGVVSIGAMLNISANGSLYFILANGLKYITPDFQVSVDKDAQTLSFTKTGTQYLLVIRPLTEADQKTFYPTLAFQDLNEFKDFLQRIAMNLMGGTQELTDQAITTDDSGNVLGMFQETPDGMYRREDKQWIALKPDDQDWTDVEDRSWLNVLIGAIELFDSNENADSSSVDEYNKFIVS